MSGPPSAQQPSCLLHRQCDGRKERAINIVGRTGSNGCRHTVLAHQANHDDTSGSICPSGLLLVFTACSWSAPRGSFHETIVRARRDGTTTVRLAPTDKAWSTAYFFGPYTPDAEIDRVLGFPCEVCHLIDLDERDDMNAVVLIAGNQLVQVQELPRSAADIRPSLLKTPYYPNTVFKLIRDGQKRYWLESVDRVHQGRDAAGGVTGGVTARTRFVVAS